MKTKKILCLLLTLAMVLSVSFQTMTSVFAAGQVGSEQTSLDGRISVKDSKLIVPGGSAVTYHTKESFSGDYSIEMRAAVNHQAVGLLFGTGNPYPPLWILALVEPYGLWAHMPGNWTQVDKVAVPDVQQGAFVTMKTDIVGNSVTTSINGKQVATHTLPEGSTSGPLGLRFDTTESGEIDYIRVSQNGSVIWEDDFDRLDGTKWDFPVSVKQTSTDGRVSVEDSKLIVPGAGAVTYQTKKSFSGDYSIEMKAAVNHQAAGLLFGSGVPNPPLWILALVEPYGLWAHMPGNWMQIDKVASPDVQQGKMVIMKVDIVGNNVTTSINDKQVASHTLPEGSTSGPLGLRFAETESAEIDYIRVIQNGSVIWEDDFNTLDGTKWNFPTSIESSMEPIWQGDVAYDETVWPIANQDGSVDDIGLLYRADQILSVQNNARTTVYEEGKDYTLVDGKLRIPQGSSIPVMSYTDYHPAGGVFPDGQGGFVYWPGETADIINRQLVITYRHSDSWAFDIPADKSSQLPKTTEKLERGQKLNVVYYGDSITEGYNASGFLGTSPFLPIWSTLVTNSLQAAYPRATISGVNTALAGQTTVWGINEFQTRVNAHNPDLVVIAFGMNDAGGGINAQQFVDNTKRMMDMARAKNPDCEFVLVSTTMPNPTAPGFAGCHADYAPAMAAQLEGEGVAVADMTTMHKNLMTKKDFADMTGNNVNHPNDYLVRVYAQTVLQTITGGATQTELIYKDIPYVDGSTLSAQTLDIQLPSTGQAPYPVVVYIHGGAWVIGDKTDSETRTALNAALSQGYAVVSINYRLAQNAKWPAQIYDCKAAIRFLRANADKYGFNPDQIAVWGASAGGHLAQFMGVTNGMDRFEDLSMGSAEYSSDVQAVISNYGISDLTKWDMPEWLNGITTTGKDPITTLLGDNYTREQALDASPITHVSENTVPMFIAHGMNDNLVNPDESTVFAEKLIEVIGDEKVDTFFPAVAQHADEAFWNSADVIKLDLNFLQKRFRPTENLDSPENKRPDNWTVDLSGYPNKDLGVSYANDSATQKLHVVMPENAQGPTPLIIFVHGGGFAGGNSSGSSVLYTAGGALQALDKGYAVAMVDYRCSPEANFPKPIHDVKAAIRYLRANAEKYNLDPNNFAIWGESAGGLIVDFVGTTNNNPAYEDLSMGNPGVSSAVQAVVSWYAITDMTTQRNAQYCPAWLGFPQSQNIEVAKDASPINHVTADAPAFYLQHGMADNEVEYQDSVRLYESLKAATGNENTKLDLFPGITHAVKKFLSESNCSKIITWLDGVLVNEAPDKTALSEAVDAARALNAADYLPDGWADLQNAITEAQKVLDNPNATAEQIQQAVNALETATASLKHKADKTPLVDALAQVGEVDLSLYTESSAAAFRQALEAVNALNTDPSLSSEDNQRILDAASALLEAFDSLELKQPQPPVDANKVILKAVLDYANGAKGTPEYDNVIESVQKSFDAAQENAQTVYDDPDATQDQIDSAWQSLMREIHKLGFVRGDKTALNQLIAAAEEFAANIGRFTPATAAPFTQALTDAKAVAADGDAMQEDVAKAEESLLTAMMNLRYKADKSILAAVLAQASGIDTSLYTAETTASFLAAQAEASRVLDDEQADQQAVNAAADKLQQAIDALAPASAQTGSLQVQGDPTAATAGSTPKTGDSFPAAGAAAVLLLGAACLLFKRSRRG